MNYISTLWYSYFSGNDYSLINSYPYPFTGNLDIDRDILLHLDSEVLEAVCITDKYTNQLCNNHFWKRKIIYDGFLLPTQFFIVEPVNYKLVYKILKLIYNFINYNFNFNLVFNTRYMSYIPPIIIPSAKNILRILKKYTNDANTIAPNLFYPRQPRITIFEDNNMFDLTVKLNGPVWIEGKLTKENLIYFLFDIMYNDIIYDYKLNQNNII